ncbi:MAG: flagellar type III secretion system pore protein FliP [Rhodothermales bacterium]|nr:flagellar type III secretion system pore protein FliP [Rhodothermales bacterium]
MRNRLSALLRALPRALPLALLLLAALPAPALAQEAAPAAAQTAATPPPAAPAPPALSALPGIQLTADGEDLALPIQLLLLLTVLALAPSIVILMTSFTRLVVVFGILRTALGLQQSPPTQLLIGLSLFLTFFIMSPILTEVNEKALQPYVAGELAQEEALAVAAGPMKAFMLEQTREKDLLLFMDMAGLDGFAAPTDVPLHVLVPAFVISELRIAFQIGFMLFLPFLLVDLIVASVLMSMGMMMLPPVMISLPIKLLLFVLTDGWYLIVESVVRGYLGT